MILPILTQLGFTDNEGEVYLAILHQGKITPANISKVTGLNRTTVYSVAKVLLKRGVITEDIASKTAHLIAVPPAELRYMVEKEERELQKKKQLVEEAIIELEEVAKTTKYSIPKITFIAEEEVERYLYKQTPIWNQSLKRYDRTWWGFQAPSFVEAYQEWVNWYWKAPSHGEFQLKLLSNQSDIETAMADKRFERRQMKFWSDSGQFDTTLWINGDYIIMIVTKEHPYYLVEIHDAMLAANLRELFKGIWKTA
jgi:sugar-specific transcriptional regulator TrmB